MKLKLIAAILGLTIAIPGAVFAQNGDQYPQDQYPDDQNQDQYSKPSPNVPVQDDQNSVDQSPDQGPAYQPYDQRSNQTYDQRSYDQGSSARGPMDPSLTGNDASNTPSYNTPAPVENNSVARVSLIHGDVSTQRGDSGSWSPAVVNAPVLAGDRVSTGDKARTELQLDYANTLRLAEHSQANITQLTRTQIQIQLASGMANYSVFGNSDADAEIDTPNVAIRTEKRDSSFRILVTSDDHTEVLVRKGEVEITTPQGGTRVGEGQFITIQGTAEQAQYKIGEAPARDDWDQWNTDRDNMVLNAASRKHTDPYYVGTEDLDKNGTWSEVPDYGPVWRPNVGADWAPYRDGRWVYEPYWGWTWVSYDSWGWAPYHYGRWMVVDGGWGWWPGPVYGDPFYRPIWAPAYVSFFGFGGGIGVGFGFGYGWGSIGWLPLGPCDHFYPWYGRFGGRFGVAGFNGFNRGGFAPLHGGNRFSNVNLAMHNPSFRGATSVSGHEFGSGRMNARPIGHAELQNARFATGRLPVTPSRESFSASGRAAASSTIRNGSQNQRFYSSRGTTMAGSSRSIGSSRSPVSSHEVARQMDRPGSAAGMNRGGADRPSSNSSSAQGNSPVQGNSARSGGSSSGGWQKFSPMPPRSSSPSASPSGRGAAPSGRGAAPSGRTSEPAGRPSMGGDSVNHGSSGSPRGPVSEGRSYSSPEGRSYSAPSRSYGSEGRGSYGASFRPPLNMRQPIVAPRSYGGGAYGGGRSGPGYGAPSYGGGRSAPSYGGGHSAPSYGGGGHSSAPSSHGGGGGGSSHGGGGSHSGGGSSHGGGGSSHGGGHGR